MGSAVYSSDMPEIKLKAFLEAFSELKQRILWKWEKDSLPGKPQNVKIGKWFPQTDILGKLQLQAFMLKDTILPLCIQVA
jgi:glucuronosyltransferase